jgi:hypothetical protein
LGGTDNGRYGIRLLTWLASSKITTSKSLRGGSTWLTTMGEIAQHGFSASSGATSLRGPSRNCARGRLDRMRMGLGSVDATSGTDVMMAHRVRIASGVSPLVESARVSACTVKIRITLQVVSA